MAQEQLITYDPSKPFDVEVSWFADVAEAGRVASGYAAFVGFPQDQCDAIAIAATELASNLIRHANRGVLRFSRIESGERLGIEIESVDTGPGISDLEQAITDGYSTAGGLG